MMVAHRQNGRGARILGGRLVAAFAVLVFSLATVSVPNGPAVHASSVHKMAQTASCPIAGQCKVNPKTGCPTLGPLQPTPPLRRVGRPQDALAPLRAALRFATDEGVTIGIMVAVEYVGAVAHDTGLVHQAVMMFGAAARLREENGIPMSRAEREIADPLQAQARAALGDAAFDATWKSGWELPLDAMIALAMGDREEMVAAVGFEPATKGL